MSETAPEPAPPPPCYRHPQKAASVLCARCNRPICTDCMVSAAVGWQCPSCTTEGAKKSRHVPAFTHTSGSRTGVVGSTNPTPLVLAIVAVNVVVFFLERFGNDAAVIDKYALQPLAMHHQHEYYRAFTAMFLQANFQHIIFNMIALVIVGPAVEVLLGRARFLALYLIAGLAGSVASYLLSPAGILGLGASGAIMGLLGAYIVIGLRRRLPVARVVALLVLNLIIGFTGDIDWRAHLGGVAVGALLGFIYDYAGGLRDRTAGLALTVGASVVTLAVLALLLTGVAPGHVNLN